MRWGRSRHTEGIDLAGATIDRSSLEVIEAASDEACRPRLDPLAGLAAPREAPYARPTKDPGSLQGLWEAVNRVDP
jgi:hypothetical protein